LPPVRASDTVSRPTKYDQEQLEAWLARRVPGGYSFGTMVDSLHNIGLLWLREPNQKKEALAVLDTLLPPNYPNFRRTHPDSVVIRKVRWDYAELYDWMHYLESSMSDLNGVEITMWAIDPLGDRLVFGLVHREMLPAMVSWLVGKNVPCRLVRLTVVGRAYLLWHALLAGMMTRSVPFRIRDARAEDVASFTAAMAGAICIDWWEQLRSAERRDVDSRVPSRGWLTNVAADERPF
jgi:hypothetical protein